MGFLDNLFGGSDNASEVAANQNKALANQYYSQGSGILASGLPQATAPYTAATGNLSDLQAKYGAGSSLYLDALGVNGPEAQQKAYQSFQTSPGYQQGITTGLDAINRAQALSGQLGSGGTDLSALNYAQNNQNQQYNQWLSNLSGLVSPEMQAAGGQAGLAGGLSNVYQGNTANQIGLLTGQTQSLMGANNQIAQAEEAGSNNLLNLGQNVAKLATTALAFA
jgi:hypothetical protein